MFLVVNLRNISAVQNLSELIYFSHSSNFISDNEKLLWNWIRPLKTDSSGGINIFQYFTCNYIDLAFQIHLSIKLTMRKINVKKKKNSFTEMVTFICLE